MLCTRCLVVVSLVLTTTISAELRSASTDSSPIPSIAPAGPSVRDFGVVKGGRDNLIADNIVNLAGLSIDKGAAISRDNLEAAGTD